MQGLVDHLRNEQLLTPEALKTILEQVKSDGVTLVQGLLSSNHIDSSTLAKIVSVTYGVPIFDLKTMAEPDLDERLTPLALIRKYSALPLWQRGNTIFLGVADPTNKSAIDDFKFATSNLTFRSNHRYRVNQRVSLSVSSNYGLLR